MTIKEQLLHLLLEMKTDSNYYEVLAKEESSRYYQGKCDAYSVDANELEKILNNRVDEHGF